MENEILSKPLPQILDEMKARLDEMKARIDDLEKICRSQEDDLRAIEKDRSE